MPLPRRPAAIIFDMDGVLFDTETLYRQALMAVSGEAGHPMTDAIFHQMVGSPWPANRAFLLDHYGETYPADALREASQARLRALTAAAPFLKAGVVALLDALRRWDLPHAIATSSSHETVQAHLAHHGLAHRFPVVVAHGDYAAGKPAPDPFLTAAARMGIAPHLCMALEDSHNGVRSAAAAGMMTVMVPDLLAATQDIRALCVHVATDLHEVHDLLHAALRAA